MEGRRREEIEISVKKIKTRKGYFSIKINEELIGVFETSELRHLMEKIDNEI
jgi:hypothetical protein